MAYLNSITITGIIEKLPQKVISRDGRNVYHFVLDSEESGINNRTKNAWTNHVRVNIEASAVLIEENNDIEEFTLGLQVLIDGKIATIPMEDRIDNKFAFDTTYIIAKKIIKLD